MKFALYVVALVAGVAVWTAPVGSLFYEHREFVLGMMANDVVWSKYLDVDIKIAPTTMSTTAARNVLADVWALDGQRPPGVDGHGKPDGAAVVARALQIVAWVASSYNRQDVALKFAVTATASAIRCQILKYVLVQLHCIEKMNELQNQASQSNPPEVRNTMTHVLQKLSLLGEPIDVEYRMYRQWESVVNHDMTTVLPQDFKDFKSVVESTLNASCKLCTFEDIQDHIGFDGETENWNTPDGAMKIFSKCQDSLNRIFDEIPMKTTKTEIWDSYLNKPTTTD